MGRYQGFLVALATSSLLGFCMASSSSCVLGYRPYTCTSCMQFTKDELQFSLDTCESSDGTLLRPENAEDEVIRRYMQVYDRPQYWTGYRVSNGTVNTDTGVNISYNGNCNNEDCCLAWQLDPFELVALDCSELLPAICTTPTVFSQLNDAGSMGSGAGNEISVSVGGVQVNSSGEQTEIMFGAMVSLMCGPEGADVQWYVNGNPPEEDSDSDSNLNFVFRTSGIYQCVVTEGGNRTVTLCGVDGTPGDVESVVAVALSQTELQVTWIPPRILGTWDPYLLRYEIYYSTDEVLNVATSMMVNVTPQPQNTNTVETQLSGLEVGQTYVIGIVARSTITPASSSIPKLNTVVQTYGIAPDVSVSGLMVQRLKDDEKTLVVSWKSTILTPPMGPVSLYEVEYRDAEQAVLNKARVQPESSSLVLYAVANANDYEVRVAILVEINREPLQYEYSEFTDWVRVNGTIAEIPKPGEVEPSEDETDVDLVVAAVLVPIAVVLILVLLLVAGLLWTCSKRREDGYNVSVSEKEKGEFSRLPEKKRDSLVTSSNV